MQMEFKLPNLGENIPGGDIVHVLATPGMSVTAGSVLLEVETEKAVVEVPAANDMTIQEVHVKPGDHVTVGQTLFLVNAGSGAAPSSAPPAPVPADPETVAVAPSVPPPPLPVPVLPPIANIPPPPRS
ncbi:MAG: branched-chain alpha-keto acid dehydrogenase subunit E2, partial [Magnetococcales bacterium]|nr:branched-chain alpha-keto acid dehydrogenase subunit E2 [Magnetococcales bacterium]